MYNQIDFNSAKQYADGISEFSEFFTIQEGKKVLYMFEETFSGLTITYPQSKNIANCKDGSLLIEKNQYYQLECERIVAKIKTQVSRDNKIPLEKVYKNVYQAWIDVFQRLALNDNFHQLVAEEKIVKLDKMLVKEGIKFPENFTDIIGLCKYISTTILTELIQDTEEYVELDSNWNVM